MVESAFSFGELSLSSLSFGNCVIWGELNFLNLRSSSVKWVDDTHFIIVVYAT